MPIFNEIGKKISKISQDAVKGTKDFADITTLNNKIAEEQKLLNSFYMQIGKKYYELYSDSAEADNNFYPICVSITECMTKITDFRAEIQEIKGIKKCLACGAEVASSTTFCGICGKDTREMPGSAEQFRCPSCGKELMSDAAFCTDCGQKINIGG